MNYRYIIALLFFLIANSSIISASINKIDSLKNQQEQAKELFIKCQGAIEMLESMIEEDSKKDKK